VSTIFLNSRRHLGLGDGIPGAITYPQVGQPSCQPGYGFDMNGNLVPISQAIMDCYGNLVGAGASVGHTDCGTGEGFDMDGNVVPISQAIMDCYGNPVSKSGSPTSTVAAPLQAGPSTSAGAPTGSYLLYQGTWQIPSSHAFTTPAQILASVLQALKSSQLGLQVVKASQSGGLLTVSNFNVQIELFVNGPGFAQPNDAGSFVDSAYNRVTGLMPAVSYTVVTQLSTGAAPTGVSPFPPNQPPPATLTAWFEQNALWIGLGVVAVVVLPRFIK